VGFSLRTSGGNLYYIRNAENKKRKIVFAKEGGGGRVSASVVGCAEGFILKEPHGGGAGTLKEADRLRVQKGPEWDEGWFLRKSW